MSIIGAQACSRELPAQDKQGWLCVTVNILFPRADSPLGQPAPLPYTIGGAYPSSSAPEYYPHH